MKFIIVGENQNSEPTVEIQLKPYEKTRAALMANGVIIALFGPDGSICFQQLGETQQQKCGLFISNGTVRHF